MIAILNDQDQVLGYDTEENANNYERTEPISDEDYLAQLQKPGVYTKTSTGWDFEPIPPPEPTAAEVIELEANTALEHMAEAQLDLLKDQANAAALSAPTEKIFKIAPLFTAWADLIGKKLEKADHPYITHEGDVYLVNQDVGVVLEHQPPGPGTEALYSKVAEPGTIAPWAQPLGAHDAYNKYGSGLPKSDPVTHNGKTWISTMNANVYEPGVYGWTEHITT